MKFIFKQIDKLLKILKTDRNTFFTYVLTLLSFYFCIDRVVELIIMWFTGMPVSYWGPIKYTLVMMCPWFAFFISFASKYGYNNTKAKISFLYTYTTALYILAISFIVQGLNRLAWFFLLSAPNYQEIFLEFSDLIRPAFTSVAIYIPVVTFYPIIRWLYTKINDPIYPNTFVDSLGDYYGLDLNPSRMVTGPYSYELSLCQDRGSGKGIKVLEDRRFQGTFILGPTGAR